MAGINKNIVRLATTGIAADLLQDGGTVHSGIKLPVSLSKSSISRLKPNTTEVIKIAKTSLIRFIVQVYSLCHRIGS